MDDRHDKTAGSEPSSLTPRQTSFTVTGRTSAYLNKIRQMRPRGHSDYQPTSVYVTKGERLELSYYEESTEKISAVIGVPELNTPIVIDLNFGFNAIDVPESGLLSFIYQEAGKSVLMMIKGSYSHVPSFILNETTHAQWQSELDQLTSAPVVMLTSERAIIVVRYESARLYITDPEKLMAYYDDVIRAQDGISGVIEYGDNEWSIDPNKHLYIEADRLYMFASDGHMGFNGATPLASLLSTNPATGWGPWHESGHQRQMDPMTWGRGSGMTEVTTNLYSMATQEFLLGRATGADDGYPVMKAYRALKVRDYDKIQNVGHKMLMIWQLRLTFGNSFYPQLHQRYRLMKNPPALNSDKTQRFIVETSLISGRDLSEFFDRWGMYPTPETLRQTSDLRALEEPIWDTDDKKTYPLLPPVGTYFPELAHILSDLRADFNQTTRFSINEKWFGKFRYNMTRNGLVMATVNHAVCINCRVVFDGDRCYIDTPIQILPGEKWVVNVVTNDLSSVEYEAASTQSYPLLLVTIKNLFTDDRCAELRPGLTQFALYAYFSEVNSLQTNEIHTRLLRRAQRIYLQKMIGSVQISAGTVSVTFATAGFKNYTYVLQGTSFVYATLDKGNPSQSVLLDNTWVKYAGVEPHDIYSITVSMDHSNTPYVLFSGTLAEGRIALPIRALFTDYTMTRLTPLADQETVNALYQTVNGDPIISLANRADYRAFLGTAQRLLLAPSIARVVRTTNSLSVHFAGEAFKKLDYKLYVNGAYVSEITQGYAYYSSVNNGVWTSSGKSDSDDLCQVMCEYDGMAYTLYESSTPHGRSETGPQDPNVTHCELGGL
ncbi:M60 family metallopeptidase [Pseudomonas syringae pv. syringae]|uniref:M60 family metallopeptidase n=1 Tax=Pseudomonas syringae TaxID=317 RepID=UPI0023F63F42|nr:M60 family metallopeptidase [Pseudomonas syringae]MDF5892992.1 M60 family metallopeptidase [Pseudomonas syringae pv. syringae]